MKLQFRLGPVTAKPLAHCTIRYKMDRIYMQTSIRRHNTIVLGLLKKKKNKNAKSRFFTSRGVHENCAIMAVLHSLHWKSAIEHNGGE